MSDDEAAVIDYLLDGLPNPSTDELFGVGGRVMSASHPLPAVGARRKELGLTIDEAAEAAGVHATSLSALERGVTEWPVWFGRLLDALGLAIVPSADNYAERLRASGLTDKGAR